MNITKCMRCHMRHKDDMFGTNRLGEKFKNCNRCRAQRRVATEKQKREDNEMKARPTEEEMLLAISKDNDE
jgi:hypothetical protein